MRVISSGLKAINEHHDRALPQPIKKAVGHASKALHTLRLEQITHSFPNLADLNSPLLVLNEINLEVSPGQSLALSGPSGCGKSTLLQIIAGTLSPMSGALWWGETRLDQLTEDERAQWRLRQLGMIFQDFRLFPHLNALENVALPLELLGKSPRTAAHEASELLAQFGLTSRESHAPETLSGGEKQRVALARALVTRPTILIADEPTGNLDQETAARVEETLLSQIHARHVGLIYVTHDLRFASRADRHFGLDKGQLLERKSDLSLTSSPLHQRDQ